MHVRLGAALRGLLPGSARARLRGAVKRRRKDEPDWAWRWRNGLCTGCGGPLKGRESYDTDNAGQRYPTCACVDCTARGHSITVQLA